jgi:hypothetical protein
MQYPVVSEVWSIFEQTLMVAAKKLTEDISKHQGVDSKELWSNVKGQIKIGLLDIDIPETPITCTYMLEKGIGVIHERCRSPCLLGFSACPKHINTPDNQVQIDLPPVKRIIDFKNTQYYEFKRSIK